PEVGTTVAAGDSVGVIESVKAASDTYAPISGEVIEINDDLEDSPERINVDAYGDGWMYKLAIEDPEELENLLDAAAYSDSIVDDD
ncbi:glycine cleavage system protein H, partial [Gammaproteobacteria bacterium]|nr:glycine cleavage system protein H [Gammaproteobacteria bacterium]